MHDYLVLRTPHFLDATALQQYVFVIIIAGDQVLTSLLLFYLRKNSIRSCFELGELFIIIIKQIFIQGMG